MERSSNKSNTRDGQTEHPQEDIVDKNCDQLRCYLLNLIKNLGLIDLLYKQASEIVDDQESTEANESENECKKYPKIIHLVLNDYAKLRRVYLIDSDEMDESMKWLACLFFMRYEKNSRLYRLNEIIEMNAALALAAKVALSKSSNNTAANVGGKRRQRKKQGAELANALINHLTTRHQQDDSRSKISPLKKYRKPISIDKLLKYTNQSVQQFINKIKQLTEMLQAPKELCERIHLIESNFNVTTVLFSKYVKIFNQIFIILPQYDKDERKQRHLDELFNFGWLFFIYIKENYPEIGNDLVNSFHLLICCVNIMNETIAESNSIFRLKFEVPLSKTFSLIEFLCSNFDGNQLEVKTIYQHHFKPQLVKLNLKTWFTTTSSLFLDNLATKYLIELNNLYESLLNKDDIEIANNVDFEAKLSIDERVFLAKSDYLNRTSKAAKKFSLPASLNILNLSYDSIKEQLSCFSDSDSVHETNMLKYSNVIKNCFLKVENVILSKLLGHSEFFDYLIETCNKFYAISIDNIIDYERKLRANQKQTKDATSVENDLKKILSCDLLHKAIYTICLDVVLTFTQIQTEKHEVIDKSEREFPRLSQIKFLDLNVNLKFPWSADQLEIDTFDLFRYIEIFIRSTTHLLTDQSQQQQQRMLICLDRDVIKHLNSMEELIIESLAWSQKSNIWSHLNQLEVNASFSLLAAQQQRTQLNEPFPLNHDIYLVDTNVNTNQSLIFNNNSSGILSAAVANNSHFSSNELVLNLTPNNQTTSVNASSSPMKNPPITKVICSNENSNSSQSSLSTLSNKTTINPSKTYSQLNMNSTIKQTLTTAGKASKDQRLSNMSYILLLFFRKFYHLANVRMRDLIERLDLVNKLIEAGSNMTSAAALATPNLMSSTNPIITPVQQQTTSILTPIFSANNLNLQLVNESQQILLKNIWNLFEFSISFSLVNQTSSTRMTLMANRHLDQILMCSIYLTCRLLQIKLQFQDIIQTYRLMNSNKNKSYVYRNVFIDANEPTPNDLIYFYNQIYIKYTKKYAIYLSGTNKKLICPSPIPKLATSGPTLTQINLTNLPQFSPRKIAQSVFVSPLKSTNQTTNALTNGNMQIVQPVVSQHFRNRLKFSFDDANPAQSIFSINEMIKKNELKIKVSNKRLFSDISTNQTGATTTSTNNELNEGPDAKLKRLQQIHQTPTKTTQSTTSTSTMATLTNSLNKLQCLNTNNNYLNKIIGFANSGNGSSFLKNSVITTVSPNLNTLKSNVASQANNVSANNGNIIKMVVSNGVANGGSTNSPINNGGASTNFSKILSLGSSFTRKLQDIKTERSNLIVINKNNQTTINIAPSTNTNLNSNFK